MEPCTRWFLSNLSIKAGRCKSRWTWLAVIFTPFHSVMTIVNTFPSKGTLKIRYIGLRWDSSVKVPSPHLEKWTWCTCKAPRWFPSGVTDNCSPCLQVKIPTMPHPFVNGSQESKMFSPLSITVTLVVVCQGRASRWMGIGRWSNRGRKFEKKIIYWT